MRIVESRFPWGLDDDAYDVIRDPEIQVVVELIGRTTFAKKLILDALRAGKPVVTANRRCLRRLAMSFSRLPARITSTFGLKRLLVAESRV